MKKERPTDRQVDVLRSIVKLTQLWGYPPTVRELAEDLGVTATNGVAEHLERLEAKGCLVKKARSSRALALTPRGKFFL